MKAAGGSKDKKQQIMHSTHNKGGREGNLGTRLQFQSRKT